MWGGGGGEATCQNLEHLQKVVFLCWSFLQVYIFATTYQKAFIVGPKGYPTYPTLPFLHPNLPYLILPLPLPYPTLPPTYPTLPLPLPYPTLPYPYHLLPLPYHYYFSYPYSYFTPSTPLPLPYPLRIRTHAHNQDSRSQATLSYDSSFYHFFCKLNLAIFLPFYYQSEWIVSTLCAHLLLQFYIDSFETSQVFLT